jgi:hypothetical protein
MEWKTMARLRIYCGESDRAGGESVPDLMVRAARENAMAGATVIRGMMGYGEDKVVHTSKILRLSESLPVIIEIVDTLEKAQAFAKKAGSIMKKGLITLEQVEGLTVKN